jgi:tetratricopeptide (TPR) repeat protein
MRRTNDWLRSMIAALAIVSGSLMAPAAVQQAAAQQKDTTQEATDQKKEVVRLLQTAQQAYHKGHWYEAQMRYEDAYEQAASDSELKVHAAVGLSSLLWERGNYGQARRFIDEALAKARDLEMNESIGRLMLTLGHIEASQGQLASAEQTLKACVKLTNEGDDKVFGPLCKLNRRLVRELQGKSVGPEAEYRATIKQLKSTETPLTVGMSLAKTAELYAEGGDTNRALELVGQASAQYQKANSVPASTRVKLQKARILQDAGQWRAARSALSGLVEKFQQMGSKPALVQTLGLLGNDAQYRGNWGQAHERFQQSLKVAKETGSPQMIAKAQLALCDLGARAPEAVSSETCEAAAETFDQLGMPRLTAKAYGARGRRMQAQGSFDAARKAYVQAVETLETQVHPSLYGDQLARVRANLCQVDMQIEATGTYYRCRKALEAVESAGLEEPGLRAATLYAMGIAAEREGKPKEGVKHLKESIDLYRSDALNDPSSLADALLRRGVIMVEHDKLEEGITNLSEAAELVSGREQLRPARIQIRIQLAQAQLEAEQWKAATKTLEGLIRDADAAGETSNEAWAWNAKARAQLNSGNEAGAKKALNKALQRAKEAGDTDLADRVRANLKQFE